MKNYQVTIGYKAVISVEVKSTSPEEAKKDALKVFTKKRDKMYTGKISLNDDSFKADGVLDMDDTWNMVQS